MTQVIVIALFALAVGLLIGWLSGGRGASAASAERDLHLERFKQAIVDLEAAVGERNVAREAVARLEAEREAFDKEALTGQFAEVSDKLLKQFLERAEQRFKQSEELSGEALKSLIAPVHERLKSYEEAIGKVEAERREAFGMLHGQIESMRVSSESVRAEAARLGNSLRNAPKARGRWGEQQLKNVLETCGLSEHCDFQTEVSVTTEDGRLRPDVVIKIPGGRTLVVDSKISFNAYQDAFAALDETERLSHLKAHATAVRSHVNVLGSKAYQSRFADTADWVIMFIAGEHFLTAALEHDHELWDYAFEKRVLLATPTNLIAIARTVASVWQQEKMAGEARQIADAARELYARLATMGGHVARVGKNLDTAVSAYNALVGSLESQVLTQAKRFESLGVDTGGKNIDPLPVVDQSARPLVKLVSSGDAG